MWRDSVIAEDREGKRVGCGMLVYAETVALVNRVVDRR
jgi:hypothetical protein